MHICRVNTHQPIKLQIMETNKRTVAGIILIIVGIYFLLNNLDLMPFDLPWYFFKWQMILIAIGFFNLFTGNRKGAFVLVSLGLIFLLPELYPSINFRDFWPVILIVIGISFFLRSRKSLLVDTTSDNTVDELTIFGGKQKVMNSDAFEGGKTNTIFGGLEFDLTNAKLSPDGARMEVFTLFGGTEITVPQDWQVKSNVTPILGGFEDNYRNKQAVEGAPTLTISGTVMFGGIEIKRR
jgi:predicted membrane protein